MDRPGTSGRKALICAAVLSAVTLAGCGSIHATATGAGAPASPQGSPSPSPSASASAPASPAVSPGAAATQAALCGDTQAVTSLEILRADVVRVPELQIAFPDQVTVANPARARDVARALCALPAFPRGFIGCPLELPGTTYLLRFTAGARQLPAVTVEATGCEAVTGVGPVRRAATSPGFWRTLATAASVRPGGRSVFSGSQGCPSASSRPDQNNGCPALTTPGSAAVP